MNGERIIKKPGKRKMIAIAIVAALVALLVLVVLLLLKNCQVETPDIGHLSGTGDYLNLTYNGKAYEYNGRVITICLTGVDTKKSFDELEDGEADADMVMLIVIDEYGKKLSVIAFNRNTLLKDETCVLKDAYKNDGGVCGVVSAIAFGVPVTYHCVLNMEATPMIHGLVREFEVTVPNDDLADLVKGSKVTLTVDNVTSFVRDPAASGDEGRMERQEAYMRGFLNMLIESLTAENLSHIQEVINSCIGSEHVNIDVPRAKTATLLNALSVIPLENVNFYTVSGEYRTADGNTQFLVDEDDLLATIVEVFYLEK